MPYYVYAWPVPAGAAMCIIRVTAASYTPIVEFLR
jgi:hypothetical protein